MENDNLYTGKIADISAHPPFGTIKTDCVSRITGDDFFKSLNRAHIDIACGTLFYNHSLFQSLPFSSAIGKLNEEALKIAHRFIGKYYPAIHVHPKCTEFSLSQIDEFCGFGMVEINAKWLSSELSTDSYRLLEYAEKKGLAVILINDWLEIVENLAEKYPRLKIIFGGYTFSVAMLAPVANLLNKYSNLYLDLSGPVYGFNYMLHEWIKSLPTDRLLFGSFFPTTNPAGKLAAIKYELRDTDRQVSEKIFSKNFISLLEKKIHE